MRKSLLLALACLLAFTACDEKPVKFDGACDVGSVSHPGSWSFESGKYTIPAMRISPFTATALRPSSTGRPRATSRWRNHPKRRDPVQ